MWGERMNRIITSGAREENRSIASLSNGYVRKRNYVLPKAGNQSTPTDIHLHLRTEVARYRTSWTDNSASATCFVMDLNDRIAALRAVMEHAELPDDVVDNLDDPDDDRDRLSSIGHFICGHSLVYNRSNIKCADAPRRDNERERHWIATQYIQASGRVNLHVAKVVKIVCWMPSKNAHPNTHQYIMKVRTTRTTPAVVNGVTGVALDV